MGFDLMTEEQGEIVGLLRDFQEKELRPVIKEYEEPGKFPRHLHDKLGELGFHGMEIPAEYGGLGLDLRTNYLIREELGRVDCGFGFSYTLSKGTAATVLRCGTEEQKKHITGLLLDGAMGATVITEADAGSEVVALKTTAVKVGSEYVINGTKTFITNGPLADVILLLAYTDKSKGPKGLSLFMVERKHGFTTGSKENKMGLRMSETSELVFEDVRIPETNLIGKEGEGYKYVIETLTRARILNTSMVVGIAQAALDHAVDYAKVRTTFGKPIIKHQGVSFMLADMEMLTQSARQYLMYGVDLMVAGKPYSHVASGAKAFASEAAMKVTTDAVQVMGGYGYSRDYPVEKLMRDAKIFSIFEGTNQIQRMVLGGALARG